MQAVAEFGFQAVRDELNEGNSCKAVNLCHCLPRKRTVINDVSHSNTCKSECKRPAVAKKATAGQVGRVTSGKFVSLLA
jgi:hypothetical protein